MELQRIRTGRDTSVDLLKTVAILGVLTIHASAGGFGGAVGSFDWLSALFWGSITRASVPLFLLCSGALLLPPERTLPLRRLYGKNFLRLLAALLFWAMAYQCFRLAAAGTLNAATVVDAAKRVVLFQHENHLYYLHIMLLVYAFLPVTRAFVAQADRQTLRYFLALWFALGILYPTVKIFWPLTLLQGIPLQWQLNMTYASIGYGVLGYYLAVYPLRRGSAAALAIAGFALTFGLTWASSAAAGTLDGHFLEGMSVGVCALGAGLYGLGRSVKLSGCAARAAALCAQGSFCVFLVHGFFITVFWKLGLTVKLLPCLFSIPIVVAANFICSGCVYLILRKIPVVNRWLI